MALFRGEALGLLDIRGAPWAEEGLDGLKLSYLAMAHGVFFDAHRAANDCLAALHILRRPLPSGLTGRARLLHAARAPPWRIGAEAGPMTSTTS